MNSVPMRLLDGTQPYHSLFQTVHGSVSEGDPLHSAKRITLVTITHTTSPYGLKIDTLVDKSKFFGDHTTLHVTAADGYIIINCLG